jgi:predicted nucleic acid-binding protein
VRVILDTNILIGGLISPSGKPARSIDAWLDGRFSLVSHAVQLDEFRSVSPRDRIRPLLRPAEAGRLAHWPAKLKHIRQT